MYDICSERALIPEATKLKIDHLFITAHLCNTLSTLCNMLNSAFHLKTEINSNVLLET